MPVRLKNLHTVPKRLKRGGYAHYVYASRQKPLVQLVKGFGATPEAAETDAHRQLGSPEIVQKWLEAISPVSHSQAPSKRAVTDLIAAYLASGEFGRLNLQTQKDYRRYLERFRGEFGDVRVKTFENAQVIEDLTEWRDDFEDRTASADYAIRCVSALFTFGRSRGWTNAKPTKDMGKVHFSNRRDKIWTDDQLDLLCENANAALSLAVRLAAITGLRLGDLVRLTWADIRGKCIVVRTSKRRKVVQVPLTLPAQKLIAEIAKGSSVTVLTNSFGVPWTKDGLKSSFRKARERAELHSTGLRFHDLRGTAATRFKVAGLTNPQIAKIMGWSVASIDEMMALYVSSEADEAELDEMIRLIESKALSPAKLATRGD